MGGIGGDARRARETGVWALSALAGLAALGGCAVQNGQPCMVRPDGSCVVLTPAETEVYHDPDGGWGWADAGHMDDSFTIVFSFIGQGQMRDDSGSVWTYQGDNTWYADDDSEVRFQSPSEGYLWINYYDIDAHEEGRIVRVSP